MTLALPALAVTALCAWTQQPQVDPQAPGQALERMRLTVLGAASLSYHARSEGVGAATAWPRFEAEVRVERVRKNDAPPARLDLRGHGVWPGGPAPVPLDVVFDGRTVRWLSHAERMLVERTFLPDGPRSSDWPEVTRHFGRAGSELILWEALLDRPLRAAGGDVELEGTVLVDGVPCEILFVEHPSERPRWTRWTVGPDHLPRRKESGWVGEDGKSAATILTLTRWALDDDEATFELRAPEGFQASPWTPPVAERTAMLPVGSPAPDFTLQDTDGAAFRLADTRGSVVLLDFWSTHCAPCVPAMRHAQSLHERLADAGLVVLTVSAFEEPGGPDPLPLFQRLGLDYRLLLDGTAVAERYRVTVLPTLYLIDREGRVAHAYRGLAEAEEDGIEGRVEALLER